jgi:SAM-dependent methyltransferase
VRRLVRAILPARWRLALKRHARALPQRLRDFPRDAIGAVLPAAFGGPIPGPGLRSRVGGIAREEFVRVGREGAAGILGAFERARVPGRSSPDWLDFGCGCGRLARVVADSPAVARLSGVDVDATQIRWARRRLRGDFAVMRPVPPLAFAAGSFDVVYAVSIFTHLDEGEQDAWLGELSRILRPDGLLIATTHGPDLARSCPGLTAAHFDELAARGFLAVDPGGTFNERSSFHSREYLERTWRRFFTPRSFEERGFVAYQDLSTWEKARPTRG